MWSIVATVIIAVCVFLLKNVQDVPISASQPKLVLGTKGYDIEPFSSPTATGIKLEIFSWIFVQSPIGAIIRRFTLNKNGLPLLRELSASISGMPALSFPIRRLSDEETKEREDGQKHGQLYNDFTSLLMANKDSEDAAFQMKFPRRTIRYYHEKYLQGVGLQR